MDASDGVGAVRKRRLSRWSVPRFLGEVAALVLVLMCVAGACVGLASLGPGIGAAGNADIVEALVGIPFAVLIPVTLAIGVTEELVFRVGPLGAFAYLSGRLGLSPRVRTMGLVAIALASSTLFGYLHGNVQAIFLQGTVGLVLAIAFLRRGARRGYARAAMLVMLAHAAYDFAMIAALKTLGDAIMG